MYNYSARIVDVYDGDTFTFYVDLGFDVWVRSKLRLFGIDTPELRGSDREFGLIVRDYVREIIDKKMVGITVYKKGKYGRYIADVYPWIYLSGDDSEEHHSNHLLKKSLSEDLIEKGFASVVNYD